MSEKSNRHVIQQHASQKLKITFSESQLESVEAEIKKITGWKSATKKYKTIFDRFNGQKNVDRDRIIERLYSKYGV